MNPADRRRRTRRNGLLIAAILVPTAAVILLLGLVARQQHELADRRAAEARRDALEQLRWSSIIAAIARMSPPVTETAAR